MTTDSLNLQLSITDSILSVNSSEWDALTEGEAVSPFLEHGFLASLETSACACDETGWYPRHFLLKSQGTLIAAAPAYARTHSMGEFVFDQGLARAAMDMGHPYYPKLVATIPFTPAPGYRFLIHPDVSEEDITRLLIDAMQTFADQAHLHSVSILFADTQWAVLPEILGCTDSEASRGAASLENHPDSWLEWIHQSFLWTNAGYRNFDDYLARFRKNQRRSIRRERQSIESAGIRITHLEGNLASESLLDRMYDLYARTNGQFGPWAAFYLNRTWFHQAARLWGKRIIFFVARRLGDDTPLAISMVIRKGSALTGRYWGTAEYVPNLHFALCYYAPLEYAINEGLKTFDPGMGSPHKARRGFASRGFSTYHRFFNQDIFRLFASVLPEANRAERDMIRQLDESVPFKSQAGD